MRKGILGLGFLAVLGIGSWLPGYDNSPAQNIIFPEAIWAPATGGGTWVSELQVTSLAEGTTLVAYFYYGGGSYRGPVALPADGTLFHSTKFANILATMQAIDSSFTYYGRVGTLQLHTQDASHLIQAAVRTLNGSYSKTFPGLQLATSNWSQFSPYHAMMVQNLTNNAIYRSSVGFFCGSSSLTVEFRIIDANNDVVGSIFSKSFVPNEFMAFNPFVEAGVPYPTFSYDNCWLWINPTSGSGYLFCFGASANNATNDPAAHIGVQFQ